MSGGCGVSSTVGGPLTPKMASARSLFRRDGLDISDRVGEVASTCSASILCAVVSTRTGAWMLSTTESSKALAFAFAVVSAAARGKDEAVGLWGAGLVVWTIQLL